MFGFVDVSNLHVWQRCEHAFAKYGMFFSKLCCSNLFGQLKFCSAALLSSTLLSYRCKTPRATRIRCTSSSPSAAPRNTTLAQRWPVWTKEVRTWRDDAVIPKGMDTPWFLLVKHGLLENTLFMDDFLIKTFICDFTDSYVWLLEGLHFSSQTAAVWCDMCIFVYIYIHTHVCVCFLVCQDMWKNNCQCKCFRQDDGKARPCFIIDHFGTSVQSIFGVPIGRATGPDVARIWWNWWLQWCNWHRENKIYAWKECGWHVSGKRECLHPVVIRLFLDICLQYVYMSLKSLRYTHTSWKLYKCGLKFKPGRITGVDQIQICTWRGWGCRSLAFCKTKWLNCSVTSKTQILVPHGDCSDKIVQFLW